MMSLRLCCLAAFVSFCLPASADWIIDLPQPAGGITFQAPTIFGFSASISTNRVLWISPAGKVLIDYQTPIGTRLGPEPVVLNSRQLLAIMYPHPEEPNRQAYRLFTAIDGKPPLTNDFYPYADSPRATVLGPWEAPRDTGGLYVLDRDAWKLRRIEFPTPPGASVALQSAPAASGPWTPIRSVEVPAEAPSEFFRVEIKRP